jgi:carbon-monoxide dehydrogenase small subunit
VKIDFKVNGRRYEVDVPGARRLLDVLREDCGLTGTKEGCGEGECGACSVIIDGEVVNACLIPVAQVQGESMVTVEGLEHCGGTDLQDAFIDHGAAQCGICTPGMLISAHVFCQKRRAEGASPDRGEIREALAGNLCRCTGYQKIVDAVVDAMGRGVPLEELVPEP